MNDLISRQAAIDAIFSEPLYESGMKKRDADAVVPAIYEKIKSLPSVQPEQKKGKWIVTGMFFDFLKCSYCGYRKPWNEDIFNFCPHCGAKMEGEQ